MMFRRDIWFSGRVADRRGVDRYEKASLIFSGMEVFDHRSIINGISRSGSPILRDITTSSTVFEGAAAGKEAVMWTCLGSPDSVPYIPLLFSEDIPSYMTAEGDGNAPICSLAKKAKASGVDMGGIISGVEKIMDARFPSSYKCIRTCAYIKYRQEVEKIAKID